ncbi:hypothetical protein [Shewanella halifaxensis]|uniref:hypothetical protein n=1 Tax=Shewanella halifaxensis TaxID=271098 RepID=UPI000D59A31F|nr:hypothetical protein [Shewanella halifaxensis]
MTYRFNAITAAIALSITLTVCNSSDDNDTSLPVLGEVEATTLSACESLVTNFDFTDTAITSAAMIPAGEIDYDGRGEILLHQNIV